MNKQKKNALINMTLGAIVAIGGVVVIMNKDTAITETTQDTASSTKATTTDDVGVIIPEIEGATVELVEVGNPEINFDLHRPIKFAGAFVDNVEAQQIMTKKINDVIAEIEETGGTLQSWLNLGILWKQVDDYEGSILAWNYASELRPLNNVSYANLGSLYHLYIPDFPKSEQNFKQAIANKPDDIQSYLGLHSLYADSYVEKKALADDVLLQGLQDNPNDITLMTALARYYASIGENKKAKTYFNEAIRQAKALENIELANSLSLELEEI